MTTQQAPFVTIPATTLPDGSVVPAFGYAQYLASRGADGKVQITADAAPWVRISYHEAREACATAGYGLLTERQALAAAWHLSQQPENWTGGAVGEGDMYQGLRNWTVNSAQPATYEPTDPAERRWLVTAAGDRIYDAAGNAFSWIFDDVQGDDAGLVAKPFAEDSLSLQAPYHSLHKGMGWRPSADADWSGDALIRGGCWRSGVSAGVFYLGGDWPARRGGGVGFRCTTPIGL